MASTSSAIDLLQKVLKEEPFNIDGLTTLLGEESFREQLSHDDVAWSALDAICDFFQENQMELEMLNELLNYLACRANPKEFILGMSDRLFRAKNDTAWSCLLRPLAFSIKKLLSNRPADGTVEDAIHAALSNLVFSTRKFDKNWDPVEVSKICSKNVIKFVDEFFDEEFRNKDLAMYSVAACLTLAATPLSMIPQENKTWRTAVSRLSQVILRYSSPYAILADLTDVNYRFDRFLGTYFYSNANGRWSFLHAGLACLLSANIPEFCLPQVLDPNYRMFLSSGLAATLLIEITDTPNPDMDKAANVHQCSLACQFISSLLQSIPMDSFNSECITAVPSFTLLVRRLFMSLTGSQSSFAPDIESSVKVVKVIDEFMSRLDYTGKWQLIWMWLNQVPADSHPAGPVRAAAIDKCRSLLAYSVKLGQDSMLAEKVAKLLPMILTLTIARDNVLENQPGLIRVDAAISALSLIQYLFLVPAEKRIIDEQTRTTLGKWLEYELRPSVASTRNFLQGATTPDCQDNPSKPNPWIIFSAQLLSRLDIAECALARVEQIHEQQMKK